MLVKSIEITLKLNKNNGLGELNFVLIPYIRKIIFFFQETVSFVTEKFLFFFIWNLHHKVQKNLSKLFEIDKKK